MLSANRKYIIVVHHSILVIISMIWIVFKQELTFSCQKGLCHVTAQAVTSSAGVQTTVLLLYTLDGQHVVVLAQNHA